MRKEGALLEWPIRHGRCQSREDVMEDGVGDDCGGRQVLEQKEVKKDLGMLQANVEGEKAKEEKKDL